MRNIFFPHMASARWQSSFLSNATKPNLQAANSPVDKAPWLLLFCPLRDIILKEGLCMVTPPRVHGYDAGSWALQRKAQDCRLPVQDSECSMSACESWQRETVSIGCSQSCAVSGLLKCQYVLRKVGGHYAREALPSIPGCRLRISTQHASPPLRARGNTKDYGTALQRNQPPRGICMGISHHHRLCDRAELPKSCLQSLQDHSMLQASAPWYVTKTRSTRHVCL